MKLVNTSYKKEDVQILLKDLTSCEVKKLDTAEREAMIQHGVHYSEMLPVEYAPTEEYIKIYEKMLKTQRSKTANAIATLCEQLKYKFSEHKRIALVSFARAGIPAGVLIKHYFNKFYPEYKVSHYSISIIRGKGLDVNAMHYIAEHENVDDIQFVDGWTGKGAINNVLLDAVEQIRSTKSILNNDPDKWLKLDTELAVIADPANITTLCGTHEDLMIPSSCLNSTVSGLVSRTILNDAWIDVEHGDFHGAVYYGDDAEMLKADRTQEFIDAMDSVFDIYTAENIEDCHNQVMDLLVDGLDGLVQGYDVVNRIGRELGLDDVNKIKPGIGETTRVLLRRVPWKILINPKYKDDVELEHIYQLCAEKGVAWELSELTMGYKVVGIIKDVSADA